MLFGTSPHDNYTSIEKHYLGDWSPEKDNNSPSLDSNLSDDLFPAIEVCYSWVQTIFLFKIIIDTNLM